MDHQNGLQIVRSQLYNARQEKNRLDATIVSLKNQIQTAQSNAQIARSAGRIFGPLGGVAVGELSGTESAIRISRFESEIIDSENMLSRIISEISRLEGKLTEHEFGIPLTQNEMQREGCIQ